MSRKTELPDKRFLDLEQKYFQAQSARKQESEKWQLERVALSKQVAALKKKLSGRALTPAEENALAYSKPETANASQSEPTGAPAAATTPKKPTAREPLSPKQQSPSNAGKRPASSHSVEVVRPQQHKASELVDLPVSMVWGFDQEAAQEVRYRALLDLNKALRQQMEEAERVNKLLKSDCSQHLTRCAQLEAEITSLTRDHHGTIRERDLALQKLAMGEANVAAARQELNTRVEEEERSRQMQSFHVKDLRGRLDLAISKCEALTKDNQALTANLKEKIVETAALHGRIAATEATLANQTAANQSLVLELQNLSNQLAMERRRSLGASREVQTALLSKELAEELRMEVAALKEQLASKEREILALLDQLANTANQAEQRIASQVQEELSGAKKAAAHWERVCQLQYKDIAERTQQHVKCREQFDEAKAARDEALLTVKALQSALMVSEAKLEAVWPTHQRDCNGVPAASLNDTLRRLKTTSTKTPLPGFAHEAPQVTDLEELRAQLRDVEELNALLLAENESYKVANQLLSERVAASGRVHEGELQAERAVIATLQQKSKSKDEIVERQIDRIRLLERQVDDLKGIGVIVDNSFSIADLSPDETIIELFVGQLLFESSDQRASTVPPIFSCTIDFFAFEPIVTSPMSGYNGFVDVTLSYRVNMDSMLWYWIRSKAIRVDLLQLDTEGHSQHVATGVVSAQELINNESLHSNRPTLKGFAPLLGKDGKRIASLEFGVIVRTPFSSTFRQICSESSLAEGIVSPHT
jgi:hypothetical protein